MSLPLLEVRNLRIAFGNASNATAAVDDVSFSVAAGERFALVGESGSGKSVTALSILRLLPEAHMGGNILFEGEDLGQMGERQMRGLRGSRIAMIFQEPMTALNPLFSIGRQIVEAIELHEGLDRRAAAERAVRLLARTGIPDPAQRFHSFPHQLSGGQRQRAMIAMALACRPKLLLADEPTTALDVTIRAQIIALLYELQAEYGMAVVMITHDLNLVRSFATRVGVMERGKLVECGDTAALFNAPAHPYTRMLINSQPRRAIQPIADDAPDVLAANEVHVAFARKPTGWRGLFGNDWIPAVKGVSFRLRQGQTVGVVGESGSGKTTLAMAVLGLQAMTGGDIDFGGRRLANLDRNARRALRAELQVVFQDPFGSLSPRMTIEQIVGEGLALHQPLLAAAQRRTRIVETLREVGLDEAVLGRYPHEFSGGQRQRIAIARVLVLQPRVLVLDEPTSALDVSIQQQVLELLADLQRRHGIAYLFISHDLAVIRAMAHHVLVLKDGAVVEAGETEALMRAPAHPYTRELLAAAGVG